MSGEYEEYFTYDEPVTYKTLTFRPATMRDWMKFYNVAGILTIDKNSPPIATVETIGMSYLEYLFYAHTDESPHLIYLLKLLRVLLKDKDVPIIFAFADKSGGTLAFVVFSENKSGYLETLYFDSDGNFLDSIPSYRKNPIIIIGNEKYDKHDFKKIREIIVGQNLLKIPNDKIDKRIRDARELAKEMRYNASGAKKHASIEDQMVALFVSTGVPLETIYSLTIRKFIKALERLDNKIHYEIYLSASMSGLVQFKDKSFIKHWLSDLSSNDLDELVKYDSIEAKISGGNV